MKLIRLISLLVLISLLTYTCAASKRMIASVGIGCAAGLIAGAIYDAAQEKKNKDDKKKLQNQIGSIFKQKKSSPEYKGKIVGLGAGCLAGLGAGYYLDTMAEDMDEQLKKNGMSVKKVKGSSGETEELMINAGEKALTFQTDSANLTPDSEPKLGQIAEALNGYDETKIRISGHVSDSSASPEYKQKLSQDRADNIKTKLTGLGVDESKIYLSEGKAAAEPLVGTKATDPSNRRVEVYIKPKG